LTNWERDLSTEGSHPPKRTVLWLGGQTRKGGKPRRGTQKPGGNSIFPRKRRKPYANPRSKKGGRGALVARLHAGIMMVNRIKTSRNHCRKWKRHVVQSQDRTGHGDDGGYGTGEEVSGKPAGSSERRWAGRQKNRWGPTHKGLMEGPRGITKFWTGGTLVTQDRDGG